MSTGSHSGHGSCHSGAAGVDFDYADFAAVASGEQSDEAGDVQGRDHEPLLFHLGSPPLLMNGGFVRAMGSWGIAVIDLPGLCL